MKTALLFPGQGSQKVGMGVELIENFPIAKDAFAEADESLGFSISKLCREGSQEELSLTTNAQPAILTTSIAVLRVLRAEKELSFDCVAGHSLGEWSANVAVGALRFADAVRLVHVRGQAMQEAVPVGQGAMAALMGLEADAATSLCADASDADTRCAPANFNGGGQIVISGHREAVERAVEAAKPAGAKRAIMLDVSAPFHSQLMAPAAERMRQALSAVEIGPLSVPVITNVEAEPNSDASRVADLLVQQVTGAVRWEESMRKLRTMGVERAIEVGHGAVLRGLMRRIEKDIVVAPAGTPDEIASVEV